MSNYDMRDVLIAILNQRLFPLKNQERRISLYEIFEEQDISNYLEGKNCFFPTFQEELEYAFGKGWIARKDAANH